jgi:hypothetical protein
MYLYVKFDDPWNAYNDVMIGISAANRTRVKRIKLTEEQIKELIPKYVGNSGGNPLFESVTPISIQDD